MVIDLYTRIEAEARLVDWLNDLLDAMLPAYIRPRAHSYLNNHRTFIVQETRARKRRLIEILEFHILEGPGDSGAAVHLPHGATIIH